MPARARRTSGVEDGRRGRLSRDLIITEAAKLFNRHGYRKTSLDDLAELLEVTRSAFYYHFKTKTDILIAIQYRGVDGLDAVAREVDERSDLDDLERFWAHIEAHAAFVAENAIEVAIVFEEEGELPHEVAQEIGLRRRTYTHRLMELYNPQGAPNVDRRVAVNAILGAATWVYRWYRPEFGTPSEIARQVVTALRVAVPAS